MKPSLAILITNYNKCQYISDAVNSALNQSLTGTRVIVVDDKSTDGSSEILQQFSGIELIQNTENQGASGATINGLKRAVELDCEFCVLLDGDDVLCSNAAEYYFKILQETGSDAVITKTVRSSHRDCRGDVVDCAIEAPVTIIEDPLAHWLRFGRGGTHLCGRTGHLIAHMDPQLMIQDHQLNFSLHHDARRVVYSEALTHYYSLAVLNVNLSANQYHKVTSYVGQYVFHHNLVKDHKYFKHYTHRAFHKALGARKLAPHVDKKLARKLAFLRIVRDLVPHEARMRTIFEVNKALNGS